MPRIRKEPKISLEEKEDCMDDIDQHFHQQDYVPLQEMESDSRSEDIKEIFPLNLENSDNSDSFEEEPDSVEDSEDNHRLTNWGKSASLYYNHDLQDFDMLQNDEDAQAVAVLEEQETEAYRKKIISIHSEDNYDYFIDDSIDNKLTESNKKVELNDYPVQKEYAKMNEMSKYAAIYKRNPEICMALFLRNKFQRDYESFTENPVEDDSPDMKINEMKKSIIAQIIIHIDFYLMISSFVDKDGKLQTSNVKIHPIYKNINSSLEMLEKLNDLNLQAIRKPSPVSLNQTTNYSIRDSSREISEREDIDHFKKTKMKQNNLLKNSTRKRKSNIPSNLEPNIQNQYDDDAEDRPITYEMAKNKGLVKKSKREYKNPRVKHKIKYKKALRNRASQVAPIRKQSGKYDGEKRGINSKLVHSVNLK